SSVRIHTRHAIRLPVDLYDRIKVMAEQQGSTVQDVVEDAARAWVVLRSKTPPIAIEEVSLDAEAEQLVLRFIEFLGRAQPVAIAAAKHLIDSTLHPTPPA
ncbi:MAG: ribbon-helix-helix protein, CopG family, partial [Acidobacteria bacterium]|nr:ribbon-helix-helix protein, CopG family [Acidobacteriota bacterium]